MNGLIAFAASTTDAFGVRKLSRSDRVAIASTSITTVQPQPDSANTTSCPVPSPQPYGERVRGLFPELPGDPKPGTVIATGRAINTVYSFSSDTYAIQYAHASGCQSVAITDAVFSQPFDQAFIGMGFLESVGDEFAGRLAELHAATLVFDVLSCDVLNQNVKRVIRDAGCGIRDVIEVSGPVILVMSPIAARPPYVSRYRRNQAATQLTFPSVTMGDSVSSEPIWHAVRPRTNRVKSTSTDNTLDQRMDLAFGVSSTRDQDSHEPIIDDPQACAKYLIRYLRHHNFLSGSTGLPSSDEETGAVTSSTKPDGTFSRTGTESLLRSDQVSRAGSSIEAPNERSSTVGMSHSEVGKQTAASIRRRPRQPNDMVERCRRQPRRLTSTCFPNRPLNSNDRRPRGLGKLPRAFRGPIPSGRQPVTV